MKTWLYLVIFSLICGGGLWKFWCLGSAETVTKPAFVLIIDHPGVEIRRAGKEEWNTAQSGMELKPGDAIHTDGEGNAVIQVFGQGETRLGKKTDIVINKAEQSKQIDVNLALQSGRIWTRLRRFTGLDDSYRIERNGVVATVRGTAFDVQATPTTTHVWVSESAVSLESKDIRHVLLEGYMLGIKPDGSLGKDEQITDENRQVEWFQKNQNRDQAFNTEYIASLRQSFQNRGGATPQTVSDALTRLSEWLHMTLQSSRASDLYIYYTGRRLYHITELAQQGKEGIALQEYTALEEELVNRMKQNDALRIPLRREIEMISDVLEDVTPSKPAYRLKQRIEDVRIRFAEGDALAQAHARLLSVDARLFEASNLISISSLDDADTALDAAKQGIDNVTHDLEQIKGDQQKLDVLRDKLQVLRMREGALRVRLATAIAPPLAGVTAIEPVSTLVSTTSTVMTTSSTVLTTTSTDAVQATSTAAQATSTPEVKPPEIKLPVLRTLQLSPGNISLSGEQSTTYQAMAIYTDGTRKDVTDLCVLSASNLRLGFFLKNTFTANAGVEGQVDIVATYTESGKTVRGTAMVTVRQ